MSTPDYRKFVPFILKWEGGEVNDPVDRGGHTNMGITRTTFNALSKKVIGKEPSTKNFRNLSKTEAAQFIRYFWMKATWDNRIRSQAVAEAITSWYWGSGNYGIKEWQRMLRDHFGKKDILVDGKVGKQTVGYTNAIPEKEVLEKAIECRGKTYRKLVQKDPRQSKFLSGWLNRLNDFAKRHGNILAASGFGSLGVLIGLGLLFF